MKFNKLIENILYEIDQENMIKIGMFPGSFTPPHIGHFNIVKKMIQDGNDYIIVLASAKERQGMAGNISDRMWREVYIPILQPNVMIQYSPISPVKDVADLVILSAGGISKPPVAPQIESLSKQLKGENLLFNIYAGADRVVAYESIKKYQNENVQVNIIQTERPILDLGNKKYTIQDKKGNEMVLSGQVDMSGTVVRGLIKQLKIDDPLLAQIFPSEAIGMPAFAKLFKEMKTR